MRDIFSIAFYSNLMEHNEDACYAFHRPGSPMSFVRMSDSEFDAVKLAAEKQDAIASLNDTIVMAKRALDKGENVCNGLTLPLRALLKVALADLIVHMRRVKHILAQVTSETFVANNIGETVRAYAQSLNYTTGDLRNRVSNVGWHLFSDDPSWTTQRMDQYMTEKGDTWPLPPRAAATAVASASAAPAEAAEAAEAAPPAAAVEASVPPGNSLRVRIRTTVTVDEEGDSDDSGSSSSSVTDWLNAKNDELQHTCASLERRLEHATKRIANSTLQLHEARLREQYAGAWGVFAIVTMGLWSVGIACENNHLRQALNRLCIP
jgi:hypothetical protein